MSALFRDSALGQVIRYATNNKVLLYPEERPDFQCPSHYRNNAGLDAPPTPRAPADNLARDVEKPPLENAVAAEHPSGEVEKPEPENAGDVAPLPQDEARPHRPESIEEPSPLPTPATEKDFDLTQIATSRTGLSRVDTRVTMEKIHTRRDLEQAYTTATLEKGPTMPIIPEKLEDGTVLVDWYDTDDPENPQNWSLRKKNFVTFQIW